MVDKTLADKLAKIAVKQIRTGITYDPRKKRIAKVKEYDKAYANHIDKPNEGDFSNVAPVFGGFMDTLLSKLKDSVRIAFNKQEEADLKKSLKVTAMWDRDSGPTRAKWDIKDLHGKKLAANWGFAVFHISSEGDEDTPYKNVLRNINGKYFYCEPKKGNDLEEHKFLGEMNVWRSQYSLENSSVYDKEQVKKLIGSMTAQDFARNEALFLDDLEKVGPMSESGDKNCYGENMFSLTNHYMEYQGKRYYVFLDYDTGIWLRVEELKEMYSVPTDKTDALWPITAWHTHPDPFEFWSKSPADDVWPVHEQIRMILTLAFKNLKKRTNPKRIVDSELITDPSEITDDTTEIIEANLLATGGKNVSTGVFEFRTEDNTQIILNLTNFLNSFVGQQTGITPGAKGSADEDKATIYVGNIEQVAGRMGLYSKYYKQFWADGLGIRYFIGLKDHLTENQFVKMMGLQGYEWEEITKDDVNPLRDFDINIVSANEETELMSLKSRNKKESLSTAINAFKDVMNKEEALQQTLLLGGWDDEQVKAFMDRDIYGDRRIISEAAEAIQKILAGEEPKPNRGATEAFVMKIINYADDHEDSLDDDQYENLYAYASMHVKIVIRNAARRATLLLSMRQNPTEQPVPQNNGMPQQEGGAPMIPVMNGSQAPKVM